MPGTVQAAELLSVCVWKQEVNASDCLTRLTFEAFFYELYSIIGIRAFNFT